MKLHCKLLYLIELDNQLQKKKKKIVKEHITVHYNAIMHRNMYKERPILNLFKIHVLQWFLFSQAKLIF